MKINIKYYIIILFVLLFHGNLNCESIYKHKNESLKRFIHKLVLKGFPHYSIIDIKTMFYSYPDFVIGVEKIQDKIYFITLNNSRIIYDDEKVKTFDQKLNTPDIEDMLSQTYLKNSSKVFYSKNYDPGRFRVEEFLKIIYGKNKKEVINNIKSIRFLSYKVFFNSRNGALIALKKVNKELNKLLKEKPKLKKYALPLGGTFNWRYIAGTKRLSPHSFAIAIDLNTERGIYWRWMKTRDPLLLRKINKYPIEIIKIFEKHGFIWGGRWYHFDLMHFEYRPEIIYKAKLLKKEDLD